MLLNLHIKNLALIDEIQVEFGDHLNILTGETGAGKSILLGSMNAALGNKISKDMIRQGADYAYVELLFHVDDVDILKKLEEMDIPVEEGEILISRKIMNRRNICKVNERTVTVAGLKEISSLLIDIHSQHEHQSLLQKQNHLKILDAFSKNESMEIRNQIKEIYSVYESIKKQLEEEYSDQEKIKREMDFISYQIEEIRSTNLMEGEDETLEELYHKMRNSKKIMEHLFAVYQITGYEDPMSAGNQIGNALHELLNAEQFDKKLAPIREQLETVDAVMNDFNRDLCVYMSEMEFDEQEFHETEERLNQINTLKSKYGATYDEIEKHCAQLEERYDRMIHFEENREQLCLKQKKTESELQKLCKQLTVIRKKYAQELSLQMIDSLKELNFLDIQFTIQLSRTKNYTENGWDEAVFLISTNPGMPMRPLNEVASGGELSRIMLAIKSVLADVDQVDTLIFDEIDTGISGRTAQKVSEKMVMIANAHQIIAITHLPQIAAMADNHYLIEKKVCGKSTKTTIQSLDQEQSVVELARMLGGVEVTESIIESAREMKELAVKAKGY